MKGMVTHYVFEQKAPGSVPAEVVDAMAMLTSEVNSVVDEYERSLKRLGCYEVGRFHHGGALRNIGDIAMSMVAGSVMRQIDDACRRIDRMTSAAEFADHRSTIVRSKLRRDDKADLACYIRLRETVEGRCEAYLDLCCGSYPNAEREEQRVVIDAANFDEAYGFVMAHEDELNNEMRELLQAKYAELVKVA